MPAPNRQRLIRLIHVAKRDLSMDDDTYRAILQRIGKKASSADLTIPELEKVLEHLKRSGFKVRSKAKPAQAKPSRPLAQDGESKKIRALWLFLHELGAVKNPSEEALAAYVKRIAGVRLPLNFGALSPGFMRRSCAEPPASVARIAWG